MSLRVRLAAVFTLLVGVILVMVGVVTYQLLRQSLLEEIERDVARRAEMFNRTDVAGDLDTFGAPDVFLQVMGANGAVARRSGNLGDRVLPAPAGAANGNVVEVRVNDRPLFLTTAALRDGSTVVVARSPVTTYRALGTLRRLVTIVVTAAVAVTALTSWLYARAALRPIERVVDAARAVRDARDLSRRVAHNGPPDEVGRLVATFNGMLDELAEVYASLEQSNQRMRQFLADCSHELRAPLTRIRASMDLLGRLGDDDPAFRSRTIADATAETDRMARMVRHLLLLARADAGATIDRRPVRLDDALTAACRHADRMADGVALVKPAAGALAGAVVAGSTDHLEQLVLILIDNAFKYTPPPGEVRVEARTRDDTAVITVRDTGLGIPPEDLDRVFDRFYRGRNSGAATGTGLGLAIARWITEQHHGQIHVHSQLGGGSTFTVHLPLAQNPGRDDERARGPDHADAPPCSGTATTARANRDTSSGST